MFWRSTREEVHSKSNSWTLEEGIVFLVANMFRFPVNFDDENDDSKTVASWDAYSEALRKTVPELFTGEYRVLTEFGRRTNAKPGFFVSTVEYTKNAGGRNIGIIHAGADLCLRTVYMPTKWAIRVGGAPRLIRLGDGIGSSWKSEEGRTGCTRYSWTLLLCM